MLMDSRQKMSAKEALKVNISRIKGLRHGQKCVEAAQVSLSTAGKEKLWNLVSALCTLG